MQAKKYAVSPIIGNCTPTRNYAEAVSKHLPKAVTAVPSAGSTPLTCNSGVSAMQSQLQGAFRNAKPVADVKELPASQSISRKNIAESRAIIQALKSATNVVNFKQPAAHQLMQIAERIAQLPQMAWAEIGTAFFLITSLRDRGNKVLDTPEIHALWLALASKIDPALIGKRLQSSAIRNGLYWLSNVPSRQRLQKVELQEHQSAQKIPEPDQLEISAAARLRQALIPHIHKQQSFTPQTLANGVHSLTHLSNADQCRAELEFFLPYVVEAARNSPTFESQITGKIFSGLKFLHDGDVVGAYLAVLLPHVENCHVTHALTVDSGLYALINLTALSEVCALEAAFAKVIDEQPAIYLEPVNFANILFAQQNQGDSAEAEQLLLALAKKFMRSKAAFAPEHVGRSCFGLRNKSDNPGVHAVLNVIVPRILLELTPQQIGSVLYGVSNLRDEHALKPLLKAMAVRIKETGPLDSLSIVMMLLGLQNLPASAGVGAVLNACSKRLEDQTEIKNTHQQQSEIAPPFLAEVLHALKLLHHVPESRQLSCVLLNIVKPGLVSEGFDVDDKAALDALIFQSALISPRTQITQPRQMEFDLHGLNYPLATTLCAEILRRFQTNHEWDQLSVVFGKATHTPANFGRMKKVVEQVLNSEQFGLAFEATWKDARVNLLRRTTLAQPNADSGNSKRPDPKLDLVVTASATSHRHN